MQSLPTVPAAQTLAQKLALFNPDLPLDKASTIPKLWYLDPEIYAAECKSIFANGWQCVGRVDQLAAPGRYITAEIGGEPVVVARDNDGRLNAFSNVCRHRAARVALEAEGSASCFRCHYHGWTYGLSGKLKGVPEFAGVCDFKKQEIALPSWSVDTWGPFVFVHARSAAAPQPLLEFLSPLVKQSDGLDLSALKFVARKEYILECNWKLFVDNYLDGGYHVNTIHPSLAGVIDYKRYRTEVFAQSAVQISPLKPGDLSSVRSGGSAYYWWLYPSFMLNIYQDTMDLNLVYPLGPSRCKVIFDFFFRHTEGEESRRFIEQSIAVADQIQDEDVRICEEVQKGLASSSFETGRFSVRREAAGYQFHRLLAASLKTAL
jgi:choline monooxygenase